MKEMTKEEIQKIVYLILYDEYKITNIICEKTDTVIVWVRLNSFEEDKKIILLPDGIISEVKVSNIEVYKLYMFINGYSKYCSDKKGDDLGSLEQFFKYSVIHEGGNLNPVLELERNAMLHDDLYLTEAYDEGMVLWRNIVKMAKATSSDMEIVVERFDELNDVIQRESERYMYLKGLKRGMELSDGRTKANGGNKANKK